MSYDPNQAPGGGAWPAPGTPGGANPAQPGTPGEPVVYGHDQPTVPHGHPGGQTAWVPYEPPAEPLPTVEVAPKKKGGKGKIIGAVVAAVAVVGAGTFAVASFAGGSDGGADSPEAAVEKMFDAVGDLDVLGVMDSLLPGERDIMRDRAQRLVDNLQELGVLSDSADLGHVDGVEIELSDMEYETVETNVDDVADVLVSGRIEASVNGEELPIGDLVIDRFLDGRPLDVDERDSGRFQDVLVAAVQQDGRWYVSVGYTAAEYVRTGGDPDRAQFDVPDADDAIALNGADSPEGAISNLIDAVESFDLEGVIGVLDPREVGAVQRYAADFIEDAADQVASLEDEATITFGDVTYTVSRDGDEATVGLQIESVVVQFAEGAIEYRSEGNCVTITETGGEGQEMCAGSASADPDEVAEQIGELLPDDPELADDLVAFFEDVQAAFDDLGELGVTVSRVDGQWYVSALGTFADTGLAVLDALDRDEFENLIDQLEELARAANDSVILDDFELPD